MTGTTTITFHTRNGRGAFAVPYLGMIVRSKPVTINVAFDHPQHGKIIDAVLRGVDAQVLELLAFDQSCVG